MLRVRRALRPIDIEACHRLHRETLPDDALPASPETCWWVATLDGAHVAFAAAQFEPSEALVFLSRCGVQESARGQGLQRRLIKAREKWAESTGALKVVTYTALENAQSANSLIGSGYRLFVPQWYWAGAEVNYWIKNLK